MEEVNTTLYWQERGSPCKAVSDTTQQEAIAYQENRKTQAVAEEARVDTITVDSLSSENSF